MTREIIVSTPREMEAVGYELAGQISAPCTVHLKGDLGAGKTTLVKGIISGMGSQGQVVSPTYTLVEEYQTSKGGVHHLDLYRIKTAEEIESLGFRDRLAMGCIILIEWPERAEDLLPRPEWQIEIDYFENRRKVTIKDIQAPIENPHHDGNL